MPPVVASSLEDSCSTLTASLNLHLSNAAQLQLPHITISSESFSETRSQPPSPPSPASTPSPQSIPLPCSPSIPSTPSTGSPQVSTAPASSCASSQPISAPSSHTSSAESSIFDLSVFFSLNTQPEMTRDPSPEMTSPSLPSSEADPQSIPQSMSSSQASENFTAPRGTWTVSTEEYHRPTDNLQPNLQTSSEEEFIYFTETLPLSPPILISRCRGGTPQINSQATSPDTSNPQTRPNFYPISVVQARMPCSWISSRSTSPISPPFMLSSSQPSPQLHPETSSNPYPSPILHVTIIPGSWVSLPNSPIPSLFSSPVLDAATSSASTTSTVTPTSTTPIIYAGNDAENTRTSEITIAIAGLNICNPTTYGTNTDRNTNTNTCTNPNDNTDETSSINSPGIEKRSSRSCCGSSSSNTERPNAALTTLTTMRSSCEGGPYPPSPASSTGSFELGCV